MRHSLRSGAAILFAASCFYFAPASAFAQGLAVPHDLSPWAMFLAADIVVKAVMSGLVFASFVA